MIRTFDDGHSVLDIFENFQTDTNLPKFASTDGVGNSINVMDNSSALSSMSINVSPSSSNWGIGQNLVVMNATGNSRPITERFTSWMARAKTWVEDKRRLSPEVVFARLIGGR